MKKYIKPEIKDEEIELEDIIAESNLGDSVENDYDEGKGDKSPYLW